MIIKAKIVPIAAIPTMVFRASEAFELYTCPLFAITGSFINIYTISFR